MTSTKTLEQKESWLEGIANRFGLHLPTVTGMLKNCGSKAAANYVAEQVKATKNDETTVHLEFYDADMGEGITRRIPNYVRQWGTTGPLRKSAMRPLDSLDDDCTRPLYLPNDSQAVAEILPEYRALQTAETRCVAMELDEWDSLVRNCQKIAQKTANKELRRGAYARAAHAYLWKLHNPVRAAAYLEKAEDWKVASALRETLANEFELRGKPASAVRQLRKAVRNYSNFCDDIQNGRYPCSEMSYRNGVVDLQERIQNLEAKCVLQSAPALRSTNVAPWENNFYKSYSESRKEGRSSLILEDSSLNIEYVCERKKETLALEGASFRIHSKNDDICIDLSNYDLALHSDRPSLREQLSQTNLAYGILKALNSQRLYVDSHPGIAPEAKRAAYLLFDMLHLRKPVEQTTDEDLQYAARRFVALANKSDKPVHGYCKRQLVT